MVIFLKKSGNSSRSKIATLFGLRSRFVWFDRETQFQQPIYIMLTNFLSSTANSQNSEPEHFLKQRPTCNYSEGSYSVPKFHQHRCEMPMKICIKFRVISETTFFIIFNNLNF